MHRRNIFSRCAADTSGTFGIGGRAERAEKGSDDRMSRTVHVAVHSTLRDAKGETEEIKTEADGVLREVNGRIHIRYEEPGEDGTAQAVCHVAVGDGSVEVVRRGAAETRLRFMKGAVTGSTYKTPYGNLNLKIKTTNLSISRSEERLCVTLSYEIGAAGMHVSDCDMTIRVTAK